MLKLLGIFLSVFLAELGDKTQIAVLVFAAEGEISRLAIFLFASLALVASTGLAVLVGAAAGNLLETLPLKLIAGVVFVGIGLLYIVEHFRSVAS